MVSTFFRRAFVKLIGDSSWSPLLHWTLIVLAFLLPSFYWPWFSEPLVLVKYFTIIVLVSVATFSSAALIYKRQEVSCYKSFGSWLPILFLLVLAASTVNSVSPVESLVGAGQTAFMSLLFTVFSILLYFILSYNCHADRLKRLLIAGIGMGVSVSGLIGLVSLINIPVVRFFLKFAGENPLGSLITLGISVSLVGIIYLGLWLFEDKVKDVWMPSNAWRKFFHIVGLVVIVEAVSLQIITDTWLVHLSIIVPLLSIVSLALFRPKAIFHKERFTVALVWLSLSLFLLVISSPLTRFAPSEVVLDIRGTADIAISTLQTDGWVFGSGPATFVMDFTRFRPDTMASQSFFSILLDRGGSAYLTFLATWGVLPTLLFSLFILWIVWRLISGLFFTSMREAWQTHAVLGSVWLGTVAMLLFWTPDVFLYAWFWIISALVVSEDAIHKKVFDFAKSPRAGLLFSFLFAMSGIAFFFSLVFGSSVLLGEWFATRAVNAEKEGNNLSVSSSIENAVMLSPWHSGFLRAATISKMREWSDGVSKSRDADELGTVMNKALFYATRAVAINPKDARNFKNLGDVYSSLDLVVAGADIKAIEAYRSAVVVDPASPFSHLNLAKALVRSSDNAAVLITDKKIRNEVRATMLSEAETEINRALELRPLAVAAYVRSLLLERQGKLNEAISEMTTIVIARPKDAGARFELGVLHLRAGKKGLALQDFVAALKIEPTFANAKWYLATLLEDAGERDLAILELEDLLAMNPKDERVADKLRLVKEGKPPVDDIDTVEPLDVVLP